MYYGGESNVPGAPGNFGMSGDLAGHPQPIDQRAIDLQNLQKQNPALYQKLIEQKKIQTSAQSGGVPGMPGNTQGMQIANNPLSFTINESPATRRIRGVKNLAGGGSTAGEREAASRVLKNITSPIRLPNL